MQHTDMQGHIAAYKEIFRCLKKGGRFFQWHLGTKSILFTDGNDKFIDRLTIGNISERKVPLNNSGPTCFLSPKDAEEMLQSSGFKDISVESFTRTYKQMTQTVEYLAIKVQKN